jgi:hypothetical protein
MEKHTINIDVNTQKANLDVDKLDKNLTELDKTVENLADTMDMDLGAAISEIEDKLTQLAVQGKQNTEEFKSLAKEAGRLKGVIAEVDAQVEFFAATNADVGQKIGLLEDQMYRMAIAGDTTSAEFRKIQAEAAALKQSVIAVDMALDGMAMTTSQRLTGALGGAAGGFAAAQGAMSAFGGESKAVNEAILKVQAAMALTQGIDAIKQAVPAFTALKTSVVSAFQGMTTASKAFMLTGIGLVITAIAAAVAAFDGMGKSTEEIIAANKKATKSFDDYSASIENNKNQIKANTDNQVAYAEAAGRSEEYIAKLREKGAEKIIFENNKEIKNQQDKIKQLLSEDTKLALGRQASSKEQYDALIKNNQKEANQAREHLNKLKNENNDARNQIKINTLKTKTDEIDGIKAKEEEERQAAADRAKQRASDAAQQRRDALAQLRDAQNEFTEQERLSYMTEQEREVYEVNKKYEELIKLAEKYKQDTAILKENQLNEVNNINTKYAQEELAAEAEKQARLAEFQKSAQEEEAQREEDFVESYRQATTSQQQLEIDAAREKWDVLIADAEKYGADTTVLKAKQEKELADIDIKYKEEQKAREKALADQKLDAVKGGLDAIGNLATAFAGKSEKSQRRAFNIQKAANIASATIDTYKSAQAAFASAGGNPILGAVFAAIAVAAGIANITKIAKTKFEGGGGAGSVSTPSTTASTGSVTTPEFNIVGGNTANQLAGLGQQPVQAYVVSNEVTTAQSLDRNRVQNATL